jgi:hypothetical protein
MIQAERASPEARSEASSALFDRLAEMGFEKRSRFGTLIFAGSYQGRATTLTISRQTRSVHQGQTRRRRQHLGWRLRIEMGCKVMTRLFFVKESVTRWRLLRWLYRLKKQKLIEDLPAVLEGFHVIARDAIWGQDLLKDQAAMSRVASLLTERSSEQLRGSVYFQPEHLHYGSGLLQPKDINAAWVESILQRAARIAESAERLPAPVVQDRSTRLERWSRTHPLQTGCLILAAILAGLLLIVAAGLGVFLVVAWGLSSL